MGKGSAGDVVDAGGCDGRYRFEANRAGGFGLETSIDEGDGFLFNSPRVGGETE